MHFHKACIKTNKIVENKKGALLNGVHHKTVRAIKFKDPR